MGELGALFNPGMRHELEEQQAKAARREEEGNARDGDLRIDLDSGVAVINTPGEDADAADASDSKARPAQDPADDPTASTDTDTAADEPSADPGEQAPLRPRGKRAMAAGKR